MRARTGFTLIELMIVIIVAAVLAAIALPSYRQSVYKSRRAEAMTALANMQQAQERWRSNATTYQDTLANPVGASAATSPSGYYALSIVANSVSASGYALRATAAGTQTGDTGCQIFEVLAANGTITYRSYAAGGAQNGTPDRCWVR